LGVPKWRTVVKVVIPTAFSGLLTGVVLGVARVAGETAPLLILGGYSATTNGNLFSGFQAALPSFINQEFIDFRSGGGGATSYHLDANGNRVAGAAANFSVDRMWGAALTLLVIILALNLIARLISRRNKVAH
jgi:phosphate transport system permease protein